MFYEHKEAIVFLLYIYPLFEPHDNTLISVDHKKKEHVYTMTKYLSQEILLAIWLTTSYMATKLFDWTTKSLQ